MTNTSHPLYMLDSRLPSRISDIIQNHVAHNTTHTNITVSDIVQLLRKQYIEYQRKSLVVFTGQVQRCIQVKQQEALAQQQQHNNATATTNHDIIESNQPHNSSAANTIRSMKRMINHNNNNNQLESIDIVSSEDETDGHVHNTIDNSNAANNLLRTLYATPNKSNNTPFMQQSSVTTNNTPASNTKQPKTIKKHKPNGQYMNMNNNTNNTTQSSFTTEFSVPSVTLSSVGGIDNILQDIRELIEYPLLHPELYVHLGIEPPHGILLHGPPGCGKTLVANAIAGELDIPLLSISAPELITGMSGESEQRLRQLFTDALHNSPCILFIDEIDAIMPKRDNAQREMERRIVAQFLTCMDSLSNNSNSTSHSTVIVIGATNRPDSLDSALRRAGRFDREIELSIPDQSARSGILQTMTKSMKCEPNIDFDLITKKTVGYVGADLVALCKEAAVIAVNRIFQSLQNDTTNNDVIDMTDSIQDESNNVVPNDTMVDDNTQLIHSLINNNINSHMTPSQLQTHHELINRSNTSLLLRSKSTPLTDEQLSPLYITTVDFLNAISKVQPSCKREGFTSVPDVTWNDIGALDELHDELSMCILQPIKYPQQFISIGLSVPAGVLLFGPPGCGKTLVAKAIANESGASFLSVKGPELLNQYVGQSERAVRNVFQRARSSAPCVIFFDELDALAPKRSNDSSGSNVSERVVNQLLTELDGLTERKQIFVIAATNRPDIIDPAMLRPGRLDKLLYCQLPNAIQRYHILLKHTRNTPLSDTIHLHDIANDIRTDGYSGADCAALIREASVHALRDAQQQYKLLQQSHSNGNNTKQSDDLPILNIQVQPKHIEYAFTKVFPSVSEQSRKRYDRMYTQLCRARSVINSDVLNNAVNNTAAVDDNNIS